MLGDSISMANDNQSESPIKNVDFMSSLPDEILQHILSFVPTYLAIKTCVLSRRWRNIWRDVPSLFLECDIITAISVNKTLFHHKATKLSSFHLGFRFDARWIEYPVGPYDFFIVDTWIDFAMACNPENLSLDFILKHYQNYSFPDIFYNNSFLKRLTLSLYNYTTLFPRSIVFWPSLKYLWLDGCNISDEVAAKILSGCPFLESLRLKFCKKLVRLDLSKSMHLTSLEIDHGNRYSGPTIIVAPHIHYLRLLHTSKTLCSLEDVSSLIEAKLELHYFGKTCTDTFLQVVDMIVPPKLRNIQNLTLGSMFLQILSDVEVSGISFPMLEITTLTLETYILIYFVRHNADLRGVPDIARLLQNSPRLKKLTLSLGKLINLEDNCLHTFTDTRGLKFEVFQTSSEPKLIALFIELVLVNTKTIETLVVRLREKLDGKSFEELLEMAKKISQDHSNLSIVIKNNVLNF